MTTMETTHSDVPLLPDSDAGLLAATPPEIPQTLTVADHLLTVFVESGPLFESLLADIRNAKRRIWIEVYIFYNDAGPTRIAEALKEKAREGVDVRVLYDALGSVSTPATFFSSLSAAGVKVHAYHSFWEVVRRVNPFTMLNRRNHRKLIVIDEAIGYFGGMNLIDNVETVREQKAEYRPTSSGWRDVHLRIEGPQQSDLAESYIRSWARAHGEKICKRPRAYRRATFHHKGAFPSAAAQEESIHFFDSGPGNRYSHAGRIFSSLIRHARDSITISMAYFLPVGSVARALLRARRHGVRIRIIVPGKSDVKLVQRAANYLYNKLLKRGFRIYERQHRMLHSKAMVVDGLHSVVGSCNLDPRSLYTNLEFLAVIRSHAFADVIQKICRYEISESERITLAETEKTPRFQRFINYLAWSLRWWL